MGFMIRQIDENAKLTEEVSLAAIQTVIPNSTLAEVVTDLAVREKRRRKLPAEFTLLFVVAMNMFSHLALHQVLIKLLKGLRLIWPDSDFLTATKGAICQARYRVGARPMVELFHRVCKPMATKATPGAFLFGLRLMAVDGATEDVPDTPENAKAFGRHTAGERGDGAFPQVKAVYLSECGTHAVIDAGFWPCRTSERTVGRRLLRSVSEGMLLMWDTGFHSFAMAAMTRDHGAHFLCRLPSFAVLKPITVLPDGSYLAYLRPEQRGPRRGEELLVRVIKYTLTDPARPGYGEVHRLMTSLLDAKSYPALDLVCAYHERWEVELVIDEMDTHQRLPLRPLRSQRPVGVIQEFYGLLIAHYVVRSIMHDAALQAEIDPDRLSFINALELICDSVPEFQLVDSAQHPALYRRLLRDLARYQLPERDNRINPRVIKRKVLKFPVKRKEHRRWPQPSTPFCAAVAMLN